MMPGKGACHLLLNWTQFSSIAQSCLILCDPVDCMWTVRLLCLSPIPGAGSNSCPCSRWYHTTISFSVVLFSSSLQSFPASGSFPINQFFASGGQNTRISASASVLPMDMHDLFPLGSTGLISFQAKGLSRVFSNTTVQNHQFFCAQFSILSNSHPYMITGKTIAFIIPTFFCKAMLMLFKILSRFSSKEQGSFNFMAAVMIFSDFGTQGGGKYVTVSVVSSPICYEVMGPDAMILASWMLSFESAFSLSFLTFIKIL